MQTQYSIWLVACLALLASCSGGGSGSVPEQPQANDAVESLQQDLLRSGAFSLQILGDGAALGLSLAELQLGEQALPNGGTRLEVHHRDGGELHGISLRISYPADELHPLDSSRGSLLEELPGELLELSEQSTPGQLDYALIQAGFADLPGVSQSGLLASFDFAPGAAAGLRSSSAAPTSENARTELRLSSNSGQNLNWYYRSPGDYDENGEVNVGDLTPLGQHFGESGDFLYYSKTFQIDGDGNGEINIADLTSIGSNYGRQIAEYAVYRSSDPDSDYPAGSNSPDLIEALATIPHSSHAESSPDTRIGFSFLVDDLQPGEVYWVRPLDSSGNLGIASNRTDQPNGIEIGSPPVPFISADVISGEVPFSVNFNMSDSYDPDGDDLEYSVQMADGVHVFNSPASASALASLDVLEPGNYLAMAQVDGGGVSSFSQPLLIIATEDGNHQPVADLQLPGTLMGDAPFTVPFDMSGSTDADGDKLKYTLSIYSTQSPDGFLNGNDYVHDNGGQPLGEYVLQDPGEYFLFARVWDPDGLSDSSDEIKVIVTEAGNQAPHLSVFPSNASGAAPLEVKFVFSPTKCYDPDGEIVKFEFDPLGIGDWTEFNWENNDYFHTYTLGGVYRPRVRALDNDGLYGYFTTSSAVRLSGDTGTDPVAILLASENEGVGFLTVDFDASSSFDADGEIVSYSVNYNKGLGWQLLGLNPQFSKGFSKGSHTVTLRVNDERSNSDTHSVIIEVEELPIGF